MKNRTWQKMLQRIIESAGPKYPVTLLEMEFLSDAIAAVEASDFYKVKVASQVIQTLKSMALWNDNLCERFFMLRCVKAECKRDENCGINCKRLRKG